MFETDLENDPDELPKQSSGGSGGQFAVWLLGMLAVTFGYALWMGYSSRENAQIAQRERTAIGVITSVGPIWSKGPRDRYRFSFAGATYDGAGDAGPFLGKMVTVYLDQDDPAKNSLTQFSTESKRDHGTMIFLLYVSLGLAVASGLVWTNLLMNGTSDEDDPSL